MELSVQGSGPATPFLRARDRFETAFDLERPVTVAVRDDPEERTWVGHHDDRHVLTISRRAATSTMATPLTIHEFAHMHRHEEAHPSHVQSTDEVLFLGLAGRSVERATLSHCYQIANHLKDVYADDITLSVGSADRLAAFLESELAAAVLDSSAPMEDRGFTNAADPAITAVNAAFAIALLERHDAVAENHPIYDLAHAADEDAPAVDVTEFARRFRTVASDPTESEYRRTLLDLIRAYVDARSGDAEAAAAD